MSWTAEKYAARSVGRNARRTALSVLGIAVGCTLALLMESVNRGRDELFARIGAESGLGHVRIVPKLWSQRRDAKLRLADPDGALRIARALPSATVVVPRARVQALLAMGTQVAPLEIAGVDAEAEPRAFRFLKNLVAGRYLAPGESGAAVVGKAVAERLRAELGDEVLASAVGRRGNIESIMLRIVGIVATGSEEIDAGICHVALQDVGRLTGLGGLGEVTILLADWRRADEVRGQIAPLLSGGDEAITWGEIAPELRGHLDQDKTMTRFISGIILLVVLLGVASAQLAAVLERRREFAVLSALGMSAARMVRLVIEEALALGLAGAAVSLLAGVPLLAAFARSGLDLRRWMGETWTFQGVLMEPVLYGDLGPWVPWYALAVSLAATVLASLYPAWFAARTDPAAALRVAQ